MIKEMGAPVRSGYQLTGQTYEGDFQLIVC